eukprot:5050475-Pleurochrysis_carterae.AAC.1
MVKRVWARWHCVRLARPRATGCGADTRPARAESVSEGPVRQRLQYRASLQRSPLESEEMRIRFGRCGRICYSFGPPGGIGRSGVKRYAACDSLRDGHIEVWRVGCVRGGLPSVLIVGSSHERRVGAVRAGERSQASKSWLQSRRT